MLSKYKTASLFLFILLVTVILSSCVNYEQTTKLDDDGSGTMQVHYWTKMSNITMETKVGRFEFDEAKAKDNFTSSNSEVTSIKVEDQLDDSTKHVRLDVKFNDINELNRAKGFENVKSSWKESADGMELKYTLMKDTAAAKQMGSSDNTITYVFDMPSDIVSTNATRTDGKKLTWEYKLSDLDKDIDMTANVKKEGGKFCGLFGYIFALGIIGTAIIIKKVRK